MDGASILLVVATLGVSFGWQPDQDDPQAYEVTAQIEPELLDVLKSGQSVPIEAHVPAEVAPIRKVRVVVGRGELPRKTLAALAKPSNRVVRGQEPTPQTHTAHYEENDPWTSDRYPAASAASPPPARQFDQRGATIGVENIRTAQAPSPWARAESAVSETATNLRDSVEAGIQDANDHFSRLGNEVSQTTEQLGAEVNQQFQNLNGMGAGSQPSIWPAPPPATTQDDMSTTATRGAPPARGSLAGDTAAPAARSSSTSSTAWSSIRPDLAPPRLLNPPIETSGSAVSAPRVASNPKGPSFPNDASHTPLHSVLTDPTATKSTALPPPKSGGSQPNWAGDWGAVETPIGGSTAAQPPLPPPRTAHDSAEDSRWAWPTPANSSAPTSSSSTSSTTNDRYALPSAQGNPQSDIWKGFPPLNSNAPTAADSRTASKPAEPQPPMITTAQSKTASEPQPTAAGEQLPWLPLLVVSVSLAGSLGANLFLGWSYADARHRYRNLVRKTTNSFHRSTGVAA